MTTEAEIDERLAKAMADRYDKQLAKTADRLRKLADDIEREGRARRSALDDDGHPDYQSAASSVINTVMWEMANLSLPTLLGAATDAHNTVRGRVK